MAITSVRMLGAEGRARDVFQPGESIGIEVTYQADRPLDRPHFALAVWDAATRQPLVLASMLVDGQAPDRIEGSGSVTCLLDAPPLLPRTYHVWGEVYAADRQTQMVRWQPLAAFTIEGGDTEGGAGSLRHARSDAPVRAAYHWRFA